MRLKISFLTPEYPHPKVLQSAGIATSIKNLVEELKHLTAAIHVFVYNQNTSEVFDDNGITIHLIKKEYYPSGGFYFYRKKVESYLTEVIRKEGIQLLEAPDWTGILAFVKLPVPIVIRFHGTDAYFCKVEERPNKKKNFLLEKWGINSAQNYIAPTEFAKNLTAQIFSIPSSKIKVIHNGIDLSKFSISVDSKYIPYTILYFGTLIRKKGVLEMPEIFERVIAKFPNAKLILIGPDSSDKQTNTDSTWSMMKKKFSPKTFAQVEYLGKMPYSDIQKHVQNSHVCIFPTFAETLGMVTIEAMAMKKPVVSSDKGWVSEIIENNISGIMVDPKDHEKFANAIIELFCDEDKSRKMGDAARERVIAKFDIKKLAVENLEYYKQIIENKS